MQAAAQRKAQSAMEYLSTYIWALIVIAVAFFAMVSLGVFNTTTLAPKAVPGSCSVYRPFGPNTTAQARLVGVCNSELPEYVMYFNGRTNHINGSNPYVFPFTAVQWVYPTSYSGNYDVISEFDGDILPIATDLPAACHEYEVSCGDFQLSLNKSGNLQGWSNNTEANDSDGGDGLQSNILIPLNKWSLVGFYVNQNSMTVFDQNASYTFSNIVVWVPPTNAVNWTVGWQGGPEEVYGQRYFYGYITNVQLYNSTLSANELKLMYSQGPGSVPIRIQNLVAWWPMNENANDYSGDLHNGRIVNAPSIGGWESSYPI